MTSYFERYQQGAYEQVWEDLLALGPAVREAPCFNDALAVARETMRRVRVNVLLLIERLKRGGYRFDEGWLGLWKTPEEREEMRRLSPVDAPPLPHVHKRITELEDLAGSLPLSVRAFYEVVGTVNLAGVHPAWRKPRLDPLVVISLEEVLDKIHPWLYPAGEAREGPYELYIAPDETLKDGAGGSGPYVIPLPNPAADALLLAWEELPFVTYLRMCFRWGGFPGWAAYDVRPEADLAELTAGLLPV